MDRNNQDRGSAGASLTPAQEREARRKLRRIVGDGTVEDQARLLVKKVLEDAAKRRTKRAARTLVNGVARILIDAWHRRMP